MKEPKDKRTKAYKEWKKKFDAANENKSEGLGDTIEKITKATGIKKAVKFLAGEDCGCDERKKLLNDMFRYNKPLCLNEEEYIYLKGFFSINKNIVNNIEQKELLTIHNRVFNTNKQNSSYGNCVKDLVNTMKKL